MSFEKSLSIIDDMQLEVNQEARAVSLNLLRLLVKASPVDTGRFRGNWFVSTDTPFRGTEENRRQSTAINEGNSVIASAIKISYPTITLSNNLPYAERLNQGHSRQAPAKFVELTINRVIR